MNFKHILGFVLILQLAAKDVVALHEYNFEFGNKDLGIPIYNKEGTISLLSFNNYIDIPVDRSDEVTYVLVRVQALNPPKVNYDGITRTVSINYSLLEVTYSSYNIFVKGNVVKTQGIL